MHGWIIGWMDACMHGWMDGLLNGWMDRWIDECSSSVTHDGDHGG